MAQLLASGRDPRAALLDAVHSADAFFRLGKARLLAGEELSAEETTEHMGHLQRLAQLAKVAVDARLVDSLTDDRDARLDTVAKLARDALMIGLAALPELTQADHATALEAIRRHFERVAGERPAEPAPAVALPLPGAPAGGGQPMTPAATYGTGSGPLSPSLDDDGAEDDVDAEISELRAAITAMKGGPS